MTKPDPSKENGDRHWRPQPGNWQIRAPRKSDGAHTSPIKIAIASIVAQPIALKQARPRSPMHFLPSGAGLLAAPALTSCLADRGPVVFPGHAALQIPIRRLISRDMTSHFAALANQSSTARWARGVHDRATGHASRVCVFFRLCAGLSHA